MPADLNAIVAALSDYAASGSLPPGLVYVRLDSRVGSVAIDPGEPANPAVQALLDQLGIRVAIGFGPKPQIEGAGSVASNATAVLLGVGGAVAGLLLSRRPVGAVIGGVGGFMLARGHVPLGWLMGVPE